MIVTDDDRKHWSYLPLKSPPLPSVKNAASVRTPVDRFILARLREKKLGLSPQAGAQKLVRRIYFDLIGLPPTPEQVESFARQFAKSPRSAVESLVDELLASPHYGERWARHWLDVARYADSDGQEGDADRRTAHHYRDFIIRSLNDDLAFDTFVRLQLAGDELEPDNPQAVAATGFIVAGTHAVLGDNLMEEERTRERFNDLDDMITTTGVAMLGLTLGCARCHDHKYERGSVARAARRSPPLSRGGSEMEGRIRHGAKAPGRLVKGSEETTRDGGAAGENRCFENQRRRESAAEERSGGQKGKGSGGKIFQRTEG
ncbi:MAG: hypothetical protein DME19_08795 [Verrucomicrobia bacterium]|nr:MAG: hypothetical protein DME19_08795 [Verrucomicrobiota bacterium]